MACRILLKKFKAVSLMKAEKWCNRNLTALCALCISYKLPNQQRREQQQLCSPCNRQLARGMEFGCQKGLITVMKMLCVWGQTIQSFPIHTQYTLRFLSVALKPQSKKHFLDKLRLYAKPHKVIQQLTKVKYVLTPLTHCEVLGYTACSDILALCING